MEPPIVLLILALVAIMIVFWPQPKRRPRETISVSMDYEDAARLELPEGTVWSDHPAHLLAVATEDGRRDIYRWAYYDTMARRHFWILSASGVTSREVSPDILLYPPSWR